jgi:hypothetical protein
MQRLSVYEPERLKDWETKQGIHKCLRKRESDDT